MPIAIVAARSLVVLFLCFGRLFGRRGRYSERSQLYLLATVDIINYDEAEAKL